MKKINNYIPFAASLISLISGIYWQSKFPFNIFVLFFYVSILLGSLLFLLFIKKINFKFNSLIYLLFFFSGAFLFQNKKNITTKLFDLYKNRNLQLTCKVINIENISGAFYRQVIKLHVFKAGFNLLLYSKFPLKVKVSDTIKIENIKIKTPIPSNKFLKKITFKDYLLKENILASVFLSKKINYKLIHRPYFSLNRFFSSKKNQLYAKLKRKLSRVSFSYLSTIFFGNKNDKKDSKMKNKFKAWGLAHYLARSGLHIVIFILIWKFLLSLFAFNIYLRALLLLAICIIYHLLSWPSVSFYRAFYIFLLAQTGKIFNQQISFLHLLSAVSFLVLIFNPNQLFFLDFQLSFSLAFTLGWISFPAKITKS